MILYYTELNNIITNNRSKTMHRNIVHATIVGKVRNTAIQNHLQFCDNGCIGHQQIRLKKNSNKRLHCC